MEIDLQGEQLQAPEQEGWQTVPDLTLAQQIDHIRRLAIEKTEASLPKIYFNSARPPVFSHGSRAELALWYENAKAFIANREEGQPPVKWKALISPQLLRTMSKWDLDNKNPSDVTD